MVITSTILVVVILAICQAVKIAGVQGKYIPIVAIILGIIGGVFILKDLSLVSAIVAGLASVGLWETGKNTVGLVTGK